MSWSVMVLLSDQYDFTLSLLHFGDAEHRAEPLEEEIEDIADRIQRHYTGHSAGG